MDIFCKRISNIDVVHLQFLILLYVYLVRAFVQEYIVKFPFCHMVRYLLCIEFTIEVFPLSFYVSKNKRSYVRKYIASNILRKFDEKCEKLGSSREIDISAYFILFFQHAYCSHRPKCQTYEIFYSCAEIVSVSIYWYTSII